MIDTARGVRQGCHLGLTVVEQGMGFVGEPVGLNSQLGCRGAVNVESAELERVLVPLDDAQAIFQVLRLSPVSNLSHLLHTAPLRRSNRVDVGINHYR